MKECRDREFFCCPSAGGHRNYEGQGWHRKCRGGSPTAAWWFDSTAAHEVTPADTVEVTACGENRLPAAGKHTPPGVIPALQAHITGGEERAAAHKER